MFANFCIKRIHGGEIKIASPRNDLTSSAVLGEGHSNFLGPSVDVLFKNDVPKDLAGNLGNGAVFRVAVGENESGFLFALRSYPLQIANTCQIEGQLFPISMLSRHLVWPKNFYSTCTVRLLTHVLCKPTHFFFHSFIATMSYSLQTSFNSLLKDWADKYHAWGTPTRSPSRSNSR